MTLDEYAKHTAKTYPVVWIDGMPWRIERRVLAPLVPPHLVKPVDRSKVRRAMRETGPVLARWNDAWDTAPGEWWWICADDPQYDVKNFEYAARRDVRAGLRRCEVKTVTLEWLAEHGYSVYAAKQEGHGVKQYKSREKWAAGVLEPANEGFDVWACFVKGALAGYATCVRVEDAVYFSSMAWDHQYRNALPSNALVYELTREYLVIQKCRYVTDGSRVILHDTQFQEFLEKRGYRRIYCPLRVELSPLAALAVGSGLARWGRYVGLDKLAPARLAQLQAAMRLVQVVRARRTPAQAQPAAAQAQPARGRGAADDPAALGSEGDVDD